MNFANDLNIGSSSHLKFQVAVSNSYSLGDFYSESESNPQEGIKPDVASPELLDIFLELVVAAYA